MRTHTAMRPVILLVILTLCCLFQSRGFYSGHKISDIHMTYSRRVRCGSNTITPSSSLNVALDNVGQTTKITDPTNPNGAFGGIPLPYLSPGDKIKLAAGERVQKQSRDGGTGEGLVVTDVYAPPDMVFDALTQFDLYQDMIPTVRSSYVLASDDVNTRAEFILSRFKLKVNVVHRVYRDQRIVTFNLDRNRQNFVFREAEGFWHVQEPKDRPEGWSRVYLSASIVANSFVPSIIMDYAASKALPRASAWIKPHFSAVAADEIHLFNE